MSTNDPYTPPASNVQVDREGDFHIVGIKAGLLFSSPQIIASIAAIAIAAFFKSPRTLWSLILLVFATLMVTFTGYWWSTRTHPIRTTKFLGIVLFQGLIWILGIYLAGFATAWIATGKAPYVGAADFKFTLIGFAICTTWVLGLGLFVGRQLRRAKLPAAHPTAPNHSMHQTLPLRGTAGDFES